MNNTDNHDDRRAVYRVEPEASGGLTIAMVIDEQTLIAERVVNVTINGAAALFPKDGIPQMESGSTVRLRVNIPGKSEPITIEASVVAISTTDDDELKCSFRFDRGDDLLGELSQDLHSLFNRREAYRINPDHAGDNVGIELEFPPQFNDMVRYHVGLKDLSLTGAAIRTSEDLDEDLSDTEFVKLFVTLPNQPETPGAGGARASPRASQQRHYLGVKFDPNESKDYDGYAEEILNYMASMDSAPKT